MVMKVYLYLLYAVTRRYPAMDQGLRLHVPRNVYRICCIRVNFNSEKTRGHNRWQLKYQSHLLF